ncbi:hypothetical protein HK102_010249 [Quaeritorhiza haematococci]|nr:hypothetical protein HK102_010249 [Quaeritorhiza haematococci]
MKAPVRNNRFAVQQKRKRKPYEYGKLKKNLRKLKQEYEEEEEGQYRFMKNSADSTEEVNQPPRPKRKGPEHDLKAASLFDNPLPQTNDESSENEQEEASDSESPYKSNSTTRTVAKGPKKGNKKPEKNKKPQWRKAPDVLQKAYQEALKKKEEKRREMEEKRKQREEQQKKKQEYYKRRKDDTRKMMQRTKKGQPVMNNLVTHLLEKIKSSQ